MYLPDMQVREQPRQILLSHQQSIQLEYKTQQQQIAPQLYLPCSNPYFHQNMPNSDNQMFSVAEGNAIVIPKKMSLIGGLKVSFYPSLHEFGDGGKGGKIEAVEGFTFKPEIIVGGSSCQSVHDSKHCVATTTAITATTTGNCRMVSIDHVIKNLVPPENA